MHFPMMTVNDTLHFAAKTRAPQNRLDGKSRVSYVEQITEVIQTIFGLRHVKKTPVGDASLRGVSGGEKKRVSIGEALALRSLIGSWDKYVVLFSALYFEFTSSLSPAPPVVSMPLLLWSSCALSGLLPTLRVFPR